MIKRLIFWLIGIFLTISTGYYVIGKYVFHSSNAFIHLVDTIISIIGVCLNFIGQHIFTVLIVVAVAIVLFIIYKIIVKKNSCDKE